MPAERPAPSPPDERAPAVPVVLALGLGIGIDRGWSPDLSVWLIVAALCGAIMLCAIPRGTARWGMVAAVLAAWVCLGGVRHHVVWSTRSADDISACLPAEESQPARLVARVHSAVVIDPADRSRATPQWTQVDRSICRAECRWLGTAGAEQAVRGIVRLELTGHWVDVRVGDVVEVFGRLQRPSGQRNPGGFDYRAFLRAQGIDAIFRVEHPDHARVVAVERGWLDWHHNGRDALRRECERLFVRQLPPAQTPLAMSLLLGDRTRLPSDVAQQFAASGTMHLLAISGLHVGILAGLLHLVCRLMNLRPGATLVVLLVGVLGYALLTDQRPPVLRAALLAAVVLGGRAVGRQAGGYQTLAVCALLLLLYRPTDLFDPGAQLSFVAVWAIVWAGRFDVPRDVSAADPVRNLPAESRWPSWVRAVGRSLGRAYFITGAIWLFTFPLTVWHFHLLAPVGLLINVLLIPLTAVLLAAGYALLLLGLVHPWLAVLPAAVFSAGLWGLTTIVEACAGTPLGHRFAAGPPGWWLAVAFSGLAAATTLVPRIAAPRNAWRGLAVWSVAGLMWGLVPSAGGELRCTFLAVGHGNAVLIETPDGRSVLYDAGSFTDGGRAAQAIAGAFWVRRGRSLDGVILSHADVDHFNGLPGLLERVPIGCVLAAPSFLDFQQEQVVAACDAAARSGVPIRLIQAGDVLRLGAGVVGRVLHPAASLRGVPDNAASIVVRIEYAGRALLLTGDLEGVGMDQMLSQPREPVDVLMSPHHGSLNANPPLLAAWADPEVVVVSTADREAASRLEGRYGPPCRVVSTANSGAVTVRVTSRGELSIEPFLGE